MTISGRVLVTGAGGFIGSHVVERLVTDGCQVRAFLRYTAQQSPGHLRELPAGVQASIEPYYGDIHDSDAVRKAMQGIDTVFHLAALIGIPYSYRHPREVTNVNVVGTLNVLQAARDVGATRVLVTSTSEVYGSAQFVPITEAHPLHPQSPYAASKVASDALALSFHDVYALPVVVIRPFNAFGPRQSTRAIIPTIIAQALAGETVKVGSTSPRRDFTYVTDTADAFVRAAAEPKAVGQVFNVGTGRDVSVGELITLVGRHVGKHLEAVTDEQRVRPEASEVKQLLADATRAQTVLGWRPRTALADGLKQTIEWWSKMSLERAGEYAV